MNSPSKQSLRSAIQAHRSAPLASQFVARASARICRHLTCHPLFRRAQRLGLYSATEGEIDLAQLADQARRRHKTCYYPHLGPSSWMHPKMLFVPATLSWRANRYGIAEPVVPFRFAVATQTLNLLLLPLVAFDRCGQRLGRGAGYYDRLLGPLRSKPTLIGIAYARQEVTLVPHAPHDVPLDYVVTEEGWIDCRAAAENLL